jgi:hypothetical protein
MSFREGFVHYPSFSGLFVYVFDFPLFIVDTNLLQVLFYVNCSLCTCKLFACLVDVPKAVIIEEN